MDWFEKIKIYYEMGLWDIERVKNAMTKGKITAEQFKEITEQTYAQTHQDNIPNKHPDATFSANNVTI